MHIPVLLNEAIRLLDPKPGDFMIDGTMDGGGYACEIVRRLNGKGIFLGIDWDWKMIEEVDSKLAECEKQGVKVNLVNDNFVNAVELIRSHGFDRADGIVLDLGFSSEQLESSGRGFSFMRDEPLVMTYAPDAIPVRDAIRRLSETELEKIIREFGEERYAGSIAKAIRDKARKAGISTTGELVQAILSAVPKNYERGRIHPATRTFQALRIYANRELENLEKLLDSIPEILKPGGRAVIASFHSLEDRIIKTKFRECTVSGKAEILTKKPITANAEELKANPRARSAKLRAIILI